MKIRQGFVSNSSSSSFICTVCGNVESGYDASPGDLGFARCENGHEFCQTHLVGDTDDIEYYSEVPVANCPICSMNDIEEGAFTRYLLKKYGTTKEVVVADIKSHFKTLEDFENYLKGD